MLVFSNACARFFALRASLGLRSLEDGEEPVLGSSFARHFVLGAPLGPRALQDREVPVPGSVP